MRAGNNRAGILMGIAMFACASGGLRAEEPAPETIVFSPAIQAWAGLNEDLRAMGVIIAESGAVGIEGSRLNAFGNITEQIYKGYSQRAMKSPDMDLGHFLVASEQPSTSFNTPYVNITKNAAAFGFRESYESMLADRIMKSAGNLRPADVLKMALDVCENDYPLATLTAHNLLKEVAYRGRAGDQTLPCTVAWTAPGWEKDGTYNDKIQPTVIRKIDPAKIVEKLAELRTEGDPFLGKDRIGPWYHIFGVLFVGCASGQADALIGATGEYYAREVGSRLGLFDSPPDPVKEALNFWAALASVGLEKALDGQPFTVQIVGDNDNAGGLPVVLRTEILPVEMKDRVTVSWTAEGAPLPDSEGATTVFFKPERGGNKPIMVTVEVRLKDDPGNGVRARASHLVVLDLGELMIRVLDAETGERIEGASVALDGNPRKGWEKAPVPVSRGTHVVTAAAEGYREGTADVLVDVQHRLSWTVDVRLARATVELRASVMDGRTKRPVPGAVVTVNATGGRPLAKETDADGNAPFILPCPCEYSCRAEAEGFESLAKRGAVGADATEAQSMTFALKGIETEATALLRVKVFDKASGVPLSGATVLIRGPKGAMASADNGTAEFANLPKGDYEVVAVAPGYAENQNRGPVRIDPAVKPEWLGRVSLKKIAAPAAPTGTPAPDDTKVAEPAPADTDVLIVEKYRSVWPQVLTHELSRNPQHSRVEMVANAVETAPGSHRYRCAYNWWAWVKTSQGRKEGVGMRADQVIGVDAMKSDLALWKRLYGIGGE